MRDRSGALQGFQGLVALLRGFLKGFDKKACMRGCMRGSEF